MNRLAGSAYARGSDLSKAVAVRSGEGNGEGKGGGCDQTSTTEPRQAFRYPERDAPYRGDVLARSSPKAQETQPRRRALDRRSQTGVLCPNDAANSLKRELRGAAPRPWHSPSRSVPLYLRPSGQRLDPEHAPPIRPNPSQIPGRRTLRTYISSSASRVRIFSWS